MEPTTNNNPTNFAIQLMQTVAARFRGTWTNRQESDDIMKLARKSWTAIHRVSDTIHIAFLSLLAAFLVMFIVNFPRILDAQASAQRQHVLEIAAENRFYCEKWGMKSGTREHTQCTLDLQEIRARVEQHVSEDLAWW